MLTCLTLLLSALLWAEVASSNKDDCSEIVKKHVCEVKLENILNATLNAQQNIFDVSTEVLVLQRKLENMLGSPNSVDVINDISYNMKTVESIVGNLYKGITKNYNELINMNANLASMHSENVNSLTSISDLIKSLSKQSSCENDLLRKLDNIDKRLDSNSLKSEKVLAKIEEVESSVQKCQPVEIPKTTPATPCPGPVEIHHDCSVVDKKLENCERDLNSSRGSATWTPGKGGRRSFSWTLRPLEPLQLRSYGYTLSQVTHSYYKFHSQAETWYNAHRKCLNEGAHLAIIDTDAEAKILKDLFLPHHQISPSPNKDFAMVGFHATTAGLMHYFHIDGRPLSAGEFIKWHGGEPNNGGGNEKYVGEACGGIHRHSGHFVDLYCDHYYAFICEKETREPGIGKYDYSRGQYLGVESEIKPKITNVTRITPAPGYELFPDVGFYKFHSRGHTWENARRICETEGGHLAIINSEREYTVLSQLFQRLHGGRINAEFADYAFVGFHLYDGKADARTIWGDSLSEAGFSRWAPGEPNSVHKNAHTPGESCGSIHRTVGLNDLSCYKYHAFFCEQELYLLNPEY